MILGFPQKTRGGARVRPDRVRVGPRSESDSWFLGAGSESDSDPVRVGPVRLMLAKPVHPNTPGRKSFVFVAWVRVGPGSESDQFEPLRARSGSESESV